METRIGIVYHSASGTTRQLAEGVREGICQAGNVGTRLYEIVGTACCG